MRIVCDLDGTLCTTAHREPLLDVKPRTWRQYSLACIDDPPIEETVDLIRTLRRSNVEIILVSGRHPDAFELTEVWLKEQDIHYDMLTLRSIGDTRANPIIKREMVTELLAQGPIDFVIDDHPGVAQEMAELGVTTLLVSRQGGDPGVVNEVAQHIAATGPELPGPVNEALATLRDTFQRKNADYAKDTSWRSNFDAIAGQMGFSALTAADTLVAVKQARLQALTANGRAPQNEAVIDTYLDRMVYSCIAYALLLDERE